MCDTSSPELTVSYIVASIPLDTLHCPPECIDIYEILFRLFHVVYLLCAVVVSTYQVVSEEVNNQ